MLATALITLAIATGCGSSTSTSDLDIQDDPGYQSTVVVNNTGDGDITVNQTTVTDNGVFLYSADGSVSFVSGDGNIYNYPDGSVDEVSSMSGEFSSTYTETECVANGYFWCPLESTCLNLPTQGSTCTL